MYEDRGEREMKLLTIIVSGNSGERLIDALVSQGFPATKIGSTGGFLRQGNTTILAGVEAGEVESVVALVREICPAHTEYMPIPTLPIVPGQAYSPAPIEVRAGGAVVFVQPVERFEKT